MEQTRRLQAIRLTARLCLISVISAEVATGQNTTSEACLGCSVVVAQRLTCANCTITARPIAELRGIPSARITLGSFAVAREGGGYVVAGLQPSNHLLLYPSGHGAPQAITGSMSGPGPRFSWISMVTASNDELVVFGEFANRLTADGKFLQAHRFLDGARIHGVLARRGGFVVQASVNSPDRVGMPFHIVDHQGVISKSFGLDRGEQYRQNPFSDRRWITHGRGSSFWSSELTAYRLRLWNERGELERELERGPEWFEPWDPSRGLPRSALVERPRPVVLGLSMQNDSLLWVLVQVADRNWTQTVADSVRNEQRWTPAALENAFDSMIEVIDVQRGRLVATHRFPNAFMRFVGPQQVMERAGSEQALSLRVFRLDLHHPLPRKQP